MRQILHDPWAILAIWVIIAAALSLLFGGFTVAGDPNHKEEESVQSPEEK